MALQITLPSPPPLRPTSSPSSSSCSPLLSLPAARSAVAVTESSRVSGRWGVSGDATKHAARRVVLARCGVETGSVKVGQVTKINKDTFWPIVKAAAPKIVVLDMYTQWCGPCKVMAPKFQELSEKYLDVVFLKLDCNQENKSLAKELGIRVVPTFKILKEMKVVKEVTGAKFDDLVLAIESVRSC